MKRKGIAILIAFGGMVAVTPLLADDRLVEDQKKPSEGIVAAGDRVLATLDALEQQVEAVSAQFYADCLRVIPSHSVCTCLRENRPVVVTFESYLNLTYREIEIVEVIDDLSEDDQDLFRATVGARDKCVQ